MGAILRVCNPTVTEYMACDGRGVLSIHLKSQQFFLFWSTSNMSDTANKTYFSI